MVEIVKDAVSFYNSFGGYIIAGVDDSTKQIVGFNQRFSVEELQKKASAVTGHEIDCHYASCSVDVSGCSQRVGILLVPRRPYTLTPAQFRRNAPKHPERDGYEFKEGDIYLRIADECRPARTAEEFSFLCGSGRRELSLADEFRRSVVLMNNLGLKDPGFIKFVGREQYLRELWRWVCDGFTPVKLLTGMGGVGKTTLAREFAEDLIRNPPDGVEKLIWLSAKEQLFTAIQGTFQATSRVDFTDIRSLLAAILIELGTPKQMIDPEWTIQEIIDECVTALRMFPSFLVIDDVDSLESSEQQEVFQTIIQIATRTAGHGNSPSLALLTARLDLGAAPKQLLPISGLDEDDFREYCKLTAESRGIPFTLRRGSNLFSQLYKLTDGSPTFAASIIKCMENGQGLDVVLKGWKGYDGDTARRFAFGKELDQLSDSQIRTLYVGCLLGETSFIELQGVLDSNERLLNDDLGALRKYHLVTLGEDLPGGAKIVIPSSIILVIDLVVNRIRDPRRLARACARAKKGSPNIASDVGDAIRRVAALWKQQKPGDALQSAEVALRQFPDNPDLECLLGRAYLGMSPPDPIHAEIHFKRAHSLKCGRPELQDLWIKSKILNEDWMGLLEIAGLLEPTAGVTLAKVTAYFELGNIAIRRRSIQRAASQWRSGFKEISGALAASQMRGREQEGRRLQRALIESYIPAIDTLAVHGGDKLDVWNAVLEGISVGLRTQDILYLGGNSLVAWWSSVEQRRKVDMRAKDVLLNQLKRLDYLISKVTSDSGRIPSVTYLEDIRSSLQKRADRFG